MNFTLQYVIIINRDFIQRYIGVNIKRFSPLKGGAFIIIRIDKP